MNDPTPEPTARGEAADPGAVPGSRTRSDEVRALWAVREYRTVFAARVVSNLGNGMAPVALAFGVLSLKGADARSLSVVTVAQAVPLVLFMLAGGVAADRFGRARLMGGADVLGSMFSLLSAVALITGFASVPLLAFNGFAFGVLNSVWYPAFAGLMPRVTPKHLLHSANAILGTGANLAFTLGASVAGIIVAGVGAGWALLVDGTTFLIAGLLVFSLRHLDNDNDSDSSSDIASGESMLDQLRHGWREFVARRWVVVCVASAAFTHMAFEGFLGVVAPVQSKEALDGPRSMGLMLAGWGLGGIIGTVVALGLRPRHPLRVGMGVMPLMVLWVYGLAVPLPMPLLVLFAMFAGIAIDLMYQNWITTLQTQVPDDALSRVNAYDALGSTAFIPLGLLLAGPLTAFAGPTTALIVCGTTMLVATSVPLMFRDVRRLTRVEGV